MPIDENNLIVPLNLNPVCNWQKSLLITIIEPSPMTIIRNVDKYYITDLSSSLYIHLYQQERNE